jgi:hypothetical protein
MASSTAPSTPTSRNPLIELIIMVRLTCLLLATYLTINTVIKTLKQKNEKKDKRLNKSIGKNKSSHVKMIVIAPKKIKIICLFFLKSRENVPKRMIAVKMTSLANARWEVKRG